VIVLSLCWQKINFRNENCETISFRTWRGGCDGGLERRDSDVGIEQRDPLRQTDGHCFSSLPFQITHDDLPRQAWDKRLEKSRENTPAFHTLLPIELPLARTVQAPETSPSIFQPRIACRKYPSCLFSFLDSYQSRSFAKTGSGQTH
jgi:hypothetical protein